MIGGTIHVKGDTGPRCGVAMKGGNIVVEGKIGYQSGFMAHAGNCGKVKSGCVVM